MAERMCRTCKWFPVDTVRNKAGRIQSKWTTNCRWPVPPLPIAATKGIGKGVIYMTCVCATDGADCPCWEERSDG